LCAAIVRMYWFLSRSEVSGCAHMECPAGNAWWDIGGFGRFHAILRLIHSSRSSRRGGARMNNVAVVTGAHASNARHVVKAVSSDCVGSYVCCSDSSLRDESLTCAARGGGCLPQATSASWRSVPLCCEECTCTCSSFILEYTSYTTSFTSE
jgi:hypothetical protein